MQGGTEWMIDARGCVAPRLADRRAVVALLDRIVAAMDLHVISTAVHQFPAPGGITAIYLLSESHLAIHTFPESATATLNVYCCTPRTPPAWADVLGEALGATTVDATEHRRGRA
ncbi:MAG: adenosylmethionine decarboxylase [Deltaproteobacteria bacterium]|nr:adenosylmethionine decarboxylase [Deltaproteobacteria bacterium]MCW5805439.1 adenosylmethionine decarboxylase [Deltaproteobacteria bacterium]